eukprot:1511303-Prymnesium_polylepis.1
MSSSACASLDMWMKPIMLPSATRELTRSTTCTSPYCVANWRSHSVFVMCSEIGWEGKLER